MNQHGRRTAEVCDLWRAVFAGQTARVRCTLGAQAANTFTADEALDCPLWTGPGHAPCAAHGIEAVAIAPYFGGYLGEAANADTVSTWDLDDLFAEIHCTTGCFRAGEPGAILETAAWVHDYRVDLDARNAAPGGPELSLVAYEGGQHLVGAGLAGNDPRLAALTTLFVAANRDARMGAAYSDYLEDSWVAEGGELFVHFSDASLYTKFGSWGAVERLDLQDTPKNAALEAHADRLFGDGFESGSRSGWSAFQ
jgi:hypothetical protein